MKEIYEDDKMRKKRMKKYLILILAVSVVFIAVSAPGQKGGVKPGAKYSQAANVEQRRPYTLGLVLNKKDNASGQYMKVFDEILRALASHKNISLSLRLFNSFEELRNAAANGQIDFAYSQTTDAFYDMVVKSDYRPFAAISIFKKKYYSSCFYSNVSEAASDISAFKGRNALGYTNYFNYFIMREILGGSAPEEFFGSLTASPEGQSSIYALALGDTDIAFVYETNVEYMKLSNTGPLKKVKKLVCSPEYMSLAMVASPEIPPDVINKLTDFLLNIHKEKALREYKNLIELTKVRFFKVSRKDYEPTFAVIDNALKKGWKKDYDRWVKFQK